MSTNSENRRESLVKVAKALTAILGVPLALFAIISSIVNQPLIALVVALVTAILASILVVYACWAGFLEVVVAWLALTVVVLVGLVIWPDTMTVEGTILDVAGTPVSREKVVLVDIYGVSRETRTDDQGHYRFKRVPCGTYKVRARGYEVGGGAGGILPARVVYTDLTVPQPTLTNTPTSTATLTSTPTSTATSTTTPTPSPTFPPTVTSTPISTWAPTSTPTCPYQADTDEATIVRLIQAEAQAVNNEDISIIQAIFAPDAIIRDAVSGEQWNDPLARYNDLFANTDFRNLIHFGILPAGPGITDAVAYCTSGSKFEYRVGSGQWRSQCNGSILNSDPSCPPTQYGSDQWTLKKNDTGCWMITKFRFNAGHKEFPGQ